MELLPFLEMISLDGHSVAGASSLASSAIEEKLRASGKPWCAVSGWILVDVVSADGGGPLPKPMLPMIMYAHHVKIDSSHRLRVGGQRHVWVRSVLQPGWSILNRRHHLHTHGPRFQEGGGRYRGEGRPVALG